MPLNDGPHSTGNGVSDGGEDVRGGGGCSQGKPCLSPKRRAQPAGMWKLEGDGKTHAASARSGSGSASVQRGIRYCTY